MLAHRAVEAGERLAEVPVWLAECESYAASHGYRHELAHIHQVRAVWLQQRPGDAAEITGLAEHRQHAVEKLTCGVQPTLRPVVQATRARGQPTAS